MTRGPRRRKDDRAELTELQARLAEVEEALRAIRSGDVDAVVIENPAGVQVYTLEGADRPYRALIEQMQEGAITLERGGMILYCNRSFAEVIGCSMDAVVGGSFVALVAPASRSAVTVLLETGKGRGEFLLQAAGDTEVPVYLSASIVSADGVDRLCLVVTDLRQQKRNEEIVAAGQLARSILEHATEAVAVCDAHARITDVNAAAAKLGGAGAVGRRFAEAFPLQMAHSAQRPDLAPALFDARTAVSAAFTGQVVNGLEVVLDGSDGSARQLLLGAGPLYGPGGLTVGAVITLTEVTDLRRALQREQALRIEAETADKAKDEFLALLGHELRNPLGVARSAVAALDVVGSQDTEAVRLRAMMTRQVDRLARLVGDLLDVARVTAGKIVLDLAPVDVSEMAARTCQSAEVAARAAGHDLVCAGTPVTVYGDAVRLEQVVVNLLDNAVKYTPAGGHIRLSVERHGDDAVLSVTDSGVGITAEVLPKIFDLFAQADTSLDRARGGLGIGLTLVRRLVTMHGGTVTAESEGRGRGSRFVVRLPVTAAGAPGGTAAVPPAAAVPRCIVVVEDNEDAREALRLLLELEGHTVSAEPDGDRGLERILERRPDIALIDIGLPRLDGYEVARRVRLSEGARHVFLVALTGYGQPGDVARAVAAGFDTHLLKPVDPDQLARVIATAPAA
jgi:PAS domain S-box-containing protein